ncbi:MAG TPA: hypothetical protein VGM51_00440 [Armatimonadota bacterium]|jgi:hypothetical protein
MKVFRQAGFWLSTLGLLVSCAGVRAAIYASDVVATGAGPAYSLHYLLNERADSGNIVVGTVAAPDTALATIPLSGAQLAKGSHDVSFTPSGLAPGDYVFTVTVAAAPHTAYDLITPVTTLPAGTQTGYGFHVGKVPGTLSYGHLYIGDFAAAHVVDELSADGTFLQIVAQDLADPYAYVGIWVGSDGTLFASEQNTDNIRHFTPKAGATPGKPTWTQDAAYTGLVDLSGDGAFYTRGFQVFGLGPTAKVYLADYSPVPNDVLLGTLGDTVNPPVKLFDGSNLAGTRIDGLLVTADEKTIYIVGSATPGVGRHLNKFIYGPNPANGNTVEWYLDPDFAANDEALNTLLGRGRSLAFADANSLWVPQNGGANSAASANYIARVSTVPLPTSPSIAASVLRIASGLAEGPTSTADPAFVAMDADGDLRITLADAVKLVRLPSKAGTVTQTIPAPLVTGVVVGATGPTPVLPVCLDTDPKGNLVVGVRIDYTGSGTVADAFYTMALPDRGSSDAARSATFHIS